MVCKVERCEGFRRQDSLGKKKKKKMNKEAVKREVKQEVTELKCNKGKACRFKRSIYSEEEDAALSAMFLLACIICVPQSYVQ